MVETQVTGEARELEAAAQKRGREFHGLVQHVTIGGIETVIALVDGHAELDAGEHVGAELAALVGGAARPRAAASAELLLLCALEGRRYPDVLGGIGQEDTGVFEPTGDGLGYRRVAGGLAERVAQGQRGARRVADEVHVRELGAESARRQGELGVQEVGIDELELDVLAQRRELQGQ